MGKRHYIDVHYDLNINTWTRSRDVPCNKTMNMEYDEFLYRRLREILISEYGCIVPFLRDYVTTQDTEQSKVCKDPEKRKMVYARYDLLKRNKDLKVCDNPCSATQVFFGVIFDDEYDKNQAYLQIYLQSTTNINLTVLDYDGVSLVADIGGYSGLLLGVSVIHLSKLLFKSMVKVVNVRGKKWKRRDS